VADEAVNRMGAILEELGARFDLVVEAVSGFGGRLDTLRDEIFGQFAEVGGQIRFLSEQIAENRRGITAARDDLGAEIGRLGESLAKARIEFRDEAVRAVASTGERAGAQAATSGDAVGREIVETAKVLKREIVASAEMAAKKLGAELRQTSKSLANLARKFDRFDDRITVQTRDQDQRLRKLERKRGA
jgi:hypothetical protein